MTRPIAPDVQALADELRAVLDEVLEEARGGDWPAASRRVLELVAAARAVQTEIDFQGMKAWLDKAKAAA